LDPVPFARHAPTNRVVRTFAFVDLCGFTDYADRSGDEAAVTELKELRSAVREVAPLCGVRVDKWLGDGAMLVGVDAEPVVTATVAVMVRLEGHGHLAMRAGIATGPVLLLEGDDYVGRAVNVAARLCDQAQAGQVLACSDGLDIPEWVEATPQPSVKVRGLAQPVEILDLAPLHLPGPARNLLTLVLGLTRPVRARRAARE